MKHNLTVAVAGSGFMGKTHVNVLKNVVKNIIICSNDEENGKALAQNAGAKFYTDYITMLENEQIDFVSICLPTHLHHFAATEAIKRKINVLCEKPFASTVEEAEDIVNMAEKFDVQLMVAHPLRFCPYWEYLRNVFNNKSLGKLISADLYRHSSVPGWSVGNWLADAKKSGGVMVDLHIHETDISTSIFGVPDKVFARVNGGSCHSSFIYDDGRIVNTSSSWRNIQDMFKSGYDVVFENGAVRYRDNRGINLYVNDKITNICDEEIFTESLGKDMYENEIRYYINCLENKKMPQKCMPRDTVAVMKINRAEMQSAETGEIINIESV